MWELLVTLLLLSLTGLSWTNPTSPSEPGCLQISLKNESKGMLDFKNVPSQGDCLNFSGKSIERVVSGSLLQKQVKVLDLSQNNLSNLTFLTQTKTLEVLHLQGNKVKKVPPELFSNSSLKVLKLEGNPLESVPISSPYRCLESLSVDCRCNVLDSILTYCSSCTACSCHSQQGATNALRFHQQACEHRTAGGSGLYAAIFIPLAVLTLAAVLVAIFIKRRRTMAVNHDKRGSSASEGAHRYISHAGPQGDASRPIGNSAEYENIQVSSDRPGERHERRLSKNRAATQSDEPIYANAPNAYCNYNGPCGAAKSADDGIYVIPDQ